MGLRALILTATLVASGTLFAKVTEEESFTYPLNDGGQLSVSNVNGSITITGGSGDSVEITAVKSGNTQEIVDGIEINITHTPDAIVIETDLPNSDSWFQTSSNNGQVTYNITVPAGTNLEAVETVNGDVEVSGVSGDCNAESVNGSLTLSDLAGDAKLATVNGSINASFATMAGQQNVKVETVNGRVTVRLPKNADVDVSADTLNGGINGSDFGLQTDRGFVGSDLNGSIGSGSASLNIDTVNGSIKIRSNN